MQGKGSYSPVITCLEMNNLCNIRAIDFEFVAGIILI